MHILERVLTLLKIDLFRYEYFSSCIIFYIYKRDNISKINWLKYFSNLFTFKT